jgi:flagellar motor switch/type III secretory pathway protein FliN
MARAILWPQAEPAVAGAPAPAPGPLSGLDLEGVAAGFGPDFSRLAGFRVRSIPATDIPAAPLLTAARLKLGAGPDLVDLLIDQAGAASLLDRLFGAPPGQGATALPILPPGSASWLALCRLVAGAACRALAATGLAPGGSPVLPPRPVAASGQGPALELQADEARIHLCLVDPSCNAPPPTPPAADPDDWRRRARARALDVALPVTLRLADRRMGVGAVAALQPGDILPLEAPHAVDVLVGGRRLGTARLDETGGTP